MASALEIWAWDLKIITANPRPWLLLFVPVYCEKNTKTSIIWETQCHKPTILYVWGWFIPPTHGDFRDGHGPPKPRLTQLELGSASRPWFAAAANPPPMPSVEIWRNLKGGFELSHVWRAKKSTNQLSVRFSHGHKEAAKKRPSRAKPSLWCSASPRRVPCIPNRSRPVWVGGPWRFVLLFPNDLTILSSNHI